MHFHLPKPLHGWREFGGEVGIIVVGVLIALGAEQLVETLNWKHRVSSAREALSGELSSHYYDAVELRMVEPCVDAQLDRLGARLLASGERMNAVPLFREGDESYAVRTPDRPYPDAVWQGVVAEGVSSHFSDVERMSLGVHYGQARDLEALNRKLTDADTRLNSLTRPIPLDPGSRLSLLQSIDEARATNDLMALIGGQLIADINHLHMVPAAYEPAHSGTVKFCRSQHLPLRSVAQASKPVS